MKTKFKRIFSTTILGVINLGIASCCFTNTNWVYFSIYNADQSSIKLEYYNYTSDSDVEVILSPQSYFVGEQFGSRNFYLCSNLLYKTIPKIKINGDKLESLGIEQASFYKFDSQTIALNSYIIIRGDIYYLRRLNNLSLLSQISYNKQSSIYTKELSSVYKYIKNCKKHSLNGRVVGCYILEKIESTQNEK